MIYISADDFGISREATDNIIKCAVDGCVNKVSVFPNGKFAYKINELPGNVIICAHINVVEGKATSEYKDVNLLVDGMGNFNNSYFKLMMAGLTPRKKLYEKQLYTEIKSQLDIISDLTNSKTIYIDSHQHTHMIPFVFRVMMRVIKTCGYDVRYIRIPAEPIWPYIKAFSLYRTYTFANVLKQWLLKFFRLINRKYISDTESAEFMGIMFSGNMNSERISKIFPYYAEICRKQKRDVEILFHPGYTSNSTDLTAEQKIKFTKFYMSENRKKEYETVMDLNINDYERRLL